MARPTLVRVCKPLVLETIAEAAHRCLPNQDLLPFLSVPPKLGQLGVLNDKLVGSNAVETMFWLLILSVGCLKPQKSALLVLGDGGSINLVIV